MRSAILFVTVVALAAFFAAALPAQADTVTLNPSGDNVLYNANGGGVNNNFGQAEYPLNLTPRAYYVQFGTYGSGLVNVTNSILSFNLNDPAFQPDPGYALTIDSATLKFNQFYFSYSPGTVRIYQLLHDFVEGTGSNVQALPGESCWNWLAYPGPGDPADPAGIAWNTPGGYGVGTDHGSTLLASYSGPSASSGWKTFTSTADFKALVQDTVGSTLNLWGNGTADDGTSQFIFKSYSKESNYKPQLIIEYHFEVIPEPGALALLATGLIGLLCYAWRKRK